ncbi:Hypothetical protein NTJ_06056 [Nesidiocoris tenuis]|uniref:Uncharacterized protein n=1 Tax=Nesidiocoris tenuis TaxID=355587 RepID=A0ABN7AS88_9HEMI|nr:Hypothetical protein NTJ_06056 [Nesidiocoris tenuis]
MDVLSDGETSLFSPPTESGKAAETLFYCFSYHLSTFAAAGGSIKREGRPLQLSGKIMTRSKTLLGAPVFPVPVNRSHDLLGFILLFYNVSFASPSSSNIFRVEVIFRAANPQAPINLTRPCLSGTKIIYCPPESICMLVKCAFIFQGTKSRFAVKLKRELNLVE